VFGPEAIERLRRLLAGRAPEARPYPGRRQAAVLIPLFVKDGEVHVVLTKKSGRLRSHGGQVSFPGGGRDPADACLQATALRESAEEVGIRPEDVEVLGRLEDLPTATTGYVVRPFVGVIPHPYRLVPDGFEVERVLTPPLHWFGDPARRREEVWERGGRRVVVVVYEVDGAVVWGLTARLLASLVELLRGAA
jgi:8-oxo-dGTP pyrophosphatase MutT (NUDIX family)